MSAVESLLYKQGEKGFVKGWKRRWCHIKRGDTKLYYSKQKGVEHINFINLLEAEAVELCDKARGKDDFGFQIVTPTRTWNLSTASSKYRDLWVQTIRHVINNKEQFIKQLPIQRNPNLSENTKKHLLVKSESTSSLSRSSFQETEKFDPKQKKKDSGLSRSTFLFVDSRNERTVSNASGGAGTDFEIFKNATMNSAASDINQTVNTISFVDSDFFKGEPGLFELEEEVDNVKLPFLSIAEESRSETRRGIPLEPHPMMPIRMATSLPVNIPSKHFGGRFSDFTEDEDDNTSFLKPHELAARTYHEHYMKRFGREFDVPVSNTRKIKAYI